MTTRLALIAATIAILAGCDLRGGGEESSGAANADFVSNLGRNDQPDWRLGVVGLTTEGGARTRVLIEVFDTPGTAQQAEIHQGNCTSMNLPVVYRLTDLQNGVSQTVVDVPVRELRRGYLVLVQPDGLCADLARSRPPSAAPIYE